MEKETSAENKAWLKSFVPVWIGQAFSMAGSKIVQFALVWWLTELTGSATVLATATMVAMVPEIILGPIAGAYVDRWDRKRVMIVADMFIALASLWLAYQFWAGTMQIWYVYVVMLVRSFGGMFHYPAMTASTTLMVPKKHLSRVAGANQTLNGTLSIVAPVLGALLMSLLDLHFVMLVDVGTAVLAVLPLIFVFIPQPEKKEAPGKPVSIWADIRDAFQYLRGWKGMMAIMAMVMIFKIALTPAFSLIPLLVQEHFQGGAGEYSAVEAAAGVGILVGGLLISVWGGFKKKVYSFMLGLFGIGIGIFLLGMLPSGAIQSAVVVVFFIGFMIPIVDGPFMALLQSTIAPEMQGRVFALIGSLFMLTSPIGLAIAGPVSDALGLQIWYLTAGILCAACGVVGVMLPIIRTVEADEEESYSGVKERIPVEVEV
jgi:MFS transporter, DHA3 family, macrolide efflux protein